MRYLVKLLCFWKNKCVTFMKGSGLEEFVAMPLEKMEGGLQNAKHNDDRQKTLAAGRAARERDQDDQAAPDAQAAQGRADTAQIQDEANAAADGGEINPALQGEANVPLATFVLIQASCSFCPSRRR